MQVPAIQIRFLTENLINFKFIKIAINFKRYQKNLQPFELKVFSLYFSSVSGCRLCHTEGNNLTIRIKLHYLIGHNWKAAKKENYVYGMHFIFDFLNAICRLSFGEKSM